MTNNFKLNAKLITDLYKQRWQIELFFKWIKQHLKIKLNLDKTIYEISQIISVSLFEKTPVNQLFNQSELHKKQKKNLNQPSMFDL